jgi:hypothetical protein
VRGGGPLGLTLLLLGLPAQALAQSDPRFRPGEVTQVPGRDAVLLGLAEQILPAAQRRDTNHTVFHGCIDWHSSVHAHWALLRVARVTGQADEAAAWVERSLRPDGLAEEARVLRHRPRFERPYGRAWFLRLAQEFDRWARERGRADGDRLQAIADEVADGLLRRYQQRVTTSPEDGSYGSSAWALAQLHAWYAFRDSDEAREAVEGLVERHFLVEDAPALSFAEDARRPDFFSRYGAWAYLIAHSQPERLEAFLTRRPLEGLEPFPPRRGKAHHLGMVWSRAWALRALTRRVDSADRRRELDRAFQAHVRRGLTQHAEYAKDYKAYGHWVPQFAVYALTEGERPRYFH